MSLFGTSSSSEETYVEAIRDGEIIRVPESVALQEDWFILRRLTSGNVQPKTQSFTPVAPPAPKRADIGVRNPSLLNDWKLGKFGNKKNNVLNDLRPDFRWEISKRRKKENMTRHKLAELIGATENDVKMLELGELPADDFILISRVEQLFGFNLRKDPNSSVTVNLADLQKRRDERIRSAHSSRTSSSESTALSGNDIEVIEE